MPRPAYVVDVDETSGKQVHGTVRSALREKPKVSQSDGRHGRTTKKPHSDSGVKDEEYAKALQIVTAREQKEAKLERRKSTNVNPKSPRKATRPPLSHENRTSAKYSVSQRSAKDVPSHYGIPQQPAYAPPVGDMYASLAVSNPMSIPLRPRAVTTQIPPVLQQQAPYQPSYTVSSIHAPPPLSSSAYYPHTTYTAPSYPPPSPHTSYMPYAAGLQSGTPQQDYFAQHIQQAPPRPLSSRFDSIPRSQVHDPVARTASAFGTRDTRRPSLDGGHFDDAYHEDSYASRVSDGAVRRRDSIRTPSARLKEQEDARAMPPPPKPSILRKLVTKHAPEVSDEEDHRVQKERSHLREKPKTHRPSTNRHSVSYDLGKDSEHVRLETANNGRRRQSYYGQSASMDTGLGGDYEEKLHSAASYQADVAGPTLPLTAEVLKKQQRRQGGSSRSASSRDESDYKKSQTTRTTRSGSGNDDENVTIKVSGHARVVVGGAQIDCGDGGEISISRQKTIRGGSERGSEFGGQKQIDDRRSRIDRPFGRSRISSSHSYTRSSPQYQMEQYLG